MFEWYENQVSWVLPTGSFSNTYAIAISFVFLAYVLHPSVNAAFLRIKAYCAWQAVENHQTVEVTDYPLMTEICSGRGKWDAGRIVAVVLAIFSMASWGLELQLDLANVDDTVTDLFLRPPPVWAKDANNTWQVESLDVPETDLVENVPNTSGNFSIGYAKARYEVKTSDKIINGDVVVASWSTSWEDSPVELSYGGKDGIASVTNDSCLQSLKEYENSVDVYVEDNPWGKVVECSKGPEEIGNDVHLPAIKLSRPEGDTHFIFEERITYPSFMYSVWKVDTTNNKTVLSHVFHISSIARLVEAVVTEIVHKNGGTPTGGGSIALLRAFSENNSLYGNGARAAPFGENPMGYTPNALLSTIENVVVGVKLNTTALICAVFVMALTLMGIAAWSLSLGFKTKVNIYNRDELIRAVTMPTLVNDGTLPPKMRIFVRKDAFGNLCVAISNVEGHGIGITQNLQRHTTVAIDDPVRATHFSNTFDSSGSDIPPGLRTVWLSGVQVGRGRYSFQRQDNFRSLSSMAFLESPFSSRVESVWGSPSTLQDSKEAGVPLPDRLSLPLGSRSSDSVTSPGGSKELSGNKEKEGAHGGSGQQENIEYKEGGPQHLP